VLRARRSSGLRYLRAGAVVVVAVIGAVALADPQPSSIAAKHFSHANHTKLGVKTDECESCHTIDAQGVTITPGAMGHSPCMTAGCHVNDFLNSGAKSKPADHAKAVSFCLGCHPSPKNEPPVSWSKPAPVAIATHGVSEYHVEMNHFEHTKRTNCRTCHVVDPKTWVLTPDRPAHHECVLCHNPTKYPEFTMQKCALCHSTPSRTEFFPKVNRPQNSVRACNSEGYQALIRKHPGTKLACFTHERESHRIMNGKEVQCGTCHFMVDDAKLGPQYNSVTKLHQLPIIEDDAGRAHKACGSAAACHQKEVPPNATSRCGKCHDDEVAGGALGD
jgi:hypothetical protein